MQSLFLVVLVSLAEFTSQTQTFLIAPGSEERPQPIIDSKFSQFVEDVLRDNDVPGLSFTIVRRGHEQRQGYDPLEVKGSLPTVEAHTNIAEESCHEVAASLVLLRTRGGTVTTGQEASSAIRLNTSTGAVAVTVAASTPPQTPGGLLGLTVTPVSLSTTTGPVSASVSQ